MAFDPEKITFFAKTDARGQNVPFGIKAKDRTRHMYVIGKTGMGKSTLLENMAVQDIQGGEGLAFIDPHGQTAETLLQYVPEERKDDVLYFAPFDMDHPVAFNVMEDVGPDKRHLVVSGLMSVFKKIWVDAWSARMEYILSNTLLALLEYPDSTLLGVNRMLSDKDYRRRVIDNIQDPAVKAFWVDEFLKYNERYMQEAGDSIKNKTGQFTANPLIRNIIGQPKSSFNIRQMMDEKKIIIMNLSKGLIGETNANLLGSMLTTRIYLAAMSRADCTPDEMAKLSNFYFFVDEFQSFANATFADILSEARKYKLNLTIAHQYIEQMEEEVRNAVFGNVGTIVSFRVGPFDAEVLETIFNPQFYATDICNLGFAQVYMTLMIDGIGSQPFSASTMPPIETASVSYRDCIVEASRRNFGRPRAEVEHVVNEFHGIGKEESTPRQSGGGGGQSAGNRPGGNNNRSQSQGNGGSRNSGGSGGERKGGERPTGSNDRNRSGSNDRGGTSNNRSGEHKPKSKNLDDLRSVLANISKENGGEKPKAKNDSKDGDKNTRSREAAREVIIEKKSAAPQVKKDHNVPKDQSEDLKSALADVLKIGAEAAREATHGEEKNASKRQTQVAPSQPVRREQKTETQARTPEKSAPQPNVQRGEARKHMTVPTPGPAVDAAKAAERPAHNPRPAAASVPEEPKAVPPSSPTVTANDLKRMMRVSENEKPPIKY